MAAAGAPIPTLTSCPVIRFIRLAPIVWVNPGLGTKLGISKFNESNFTSWTSYSSTNVAVTNQIYSVAMAANGVKWFGAWGKGASRFDGINWVDYDASNSLPSVNVHCINIDRAGLVWVGTDSGISRFDGVNWTIWSSSVDNKTGELANNDVYSIAADYAGNIWAGTGGGLCKLDRSGWTTYTTKDGLPGNVVYAVNVDRAGSLWISTDGGVARLSDGKWNVIQSTVLAGKTILCISVDGQGNLWFGTFGDGVVKLADNNWTLYSVAQGLASNYVYSIAFDNEGAAWIGTANGLSRLGSDQPAAGPGPQPLSIR